MFGNTFSIARAASRFALGCAASAKDRSAFVTPTLLKLSEVFTPQRKYGFRSKWSEKEVIGIDLGTNNGSVAVMQDQKPIVVRNSSDTGSIPCMVSVVEGERPLVGTKARLPMRSNQSNTFYGVKRLIGRKYQDSEVQRQIATSPFNIVEAPNGDAWLRDGDGRSYSPSEISSLVISELKQIAERHLKQNVDSAVITVPAFFNDSQRKATKEAARMAGLKLVRLINESTALALAYDFTQPDEQDSLLRYETDEDKLTVVYSMGGGSFEVSLISRENGVVQTRAVRGDTMMGGEDFDNLVVDRILSELSEEEADVVRNNFMSLQRVKEAAEKARWELSDQLSTIIHIPYLTDHDHCEFFIRRGEFDFIINEMVKRTMEPCRQLLTEMGASVADVGQVLLAGGMSRTPMVQKAVEFFFDRPPVHSSGQTVAAGAAIRGGMLSGKLIEPLLLDVTPLSLGLVSRGGGFERLVGRNTVLPTRIHKPFIIATPNMLKGFELKLHQGEHEQPVAAGSSNKLISSFKLPIDSPLEIENGLCRVDVSFYVDADGIVHTSALDAVGGTVVKLEAKGPQYKPSEDEIAEIITSTIADMPEIDESVEVSDLLQRMKTFLEDAKRAVNIFRAKLPRKHTKEVMGRIVELDRELDEVVAGMPLCKAALHTKYYRVQLKTLALLHLGSEDKSLLKQ